MDDLGQVHAVGSGKAAISVNYQGLFTAIVIEIPYGMAAADFSYAHSLRANYVHEIAIRQWQRLCLWPSPPADDASFLRRVYLDLAGTLPSPRQVTEFLADSNPHKREALIDQMLESPEFVDMWVTKLGDVFRARANG